MTMDLTKIEKPFGLLDEETREALMAHEAAVGGVQFFSHAIGWEFCDPTWSRDLTYRAAPAPLRKPAIDWSHVGDNLNFLASDKDGTLHMENLHNAIMLDAQSRYNRRKEAGIYDLNKAEYEAAGSPGHQSADVELSRTKVGECTVSVDGYDLNFNKVVCRITEVESLVGKAKEMIKEWQDFVDGLEQ